MFSDNKGIISGDERIKLYNEIWNEPVAIVAKRYKISDTTLRKWCIRYGIPLPYSGYWAKIQAGHQAKKSELPEVTGEVKRYVRNYNLKYRTDINELSYDELKLLGHLDMLKSETQDRIRNKCANIKVQNQLKNPHKYILEYQDEMKYRDKRDKALSKLDPGSKKYNLAKGQYRENVEVLNITVSDFNSNRILCVLDTIFKAIEEFEGYISSLNYSGIKTAIFLMNSIILFNVKEKQSKLMLQLNPESWMNKSKIDAIVFQDQDDCPLESQVADILYQIFLCANKLFILDKLEEKEEEIRENEKKRKKLLEQIRKGELTELKEISQLALDWENANRIRKFLDAVENEAKQIMDEDKKDIINKWIMKNRSRINWFDPLMQSEDEVLGKSKSIIDEMIENVKYNRLYNMERFQ